MEFYTREKKLFVYNSVLFKMVFISIVNLTHQIVLGKTLSGSLLKKKTVFKILSNLPKWT